MLKQFILNVMNNAERIMHIQVEPKRLAELDLKIAEALQSIRVRMVAPRAEKLDEKRLVGWLLI